MLLDSKKCVMGTPLLLFEATKVVFSDKCTIKILVFSEFFATKILVNKIL